MESAVVKIQSTFRGKKIRSKLGGQKTENTKEGAAGTKATNKSEAISQSKPDSSSKEGGATKTASAATKQVSSDEELNKKVANMQVNDNSHGTNKQEAQVNVSKEDGESKESGKKKLDS